MRSSIFQDVVETCRDWIFALVCEVSDQIQANKLQKCSDFKKIRVLCIDFGQAISDLT